MSEQREKNLLVSGGFHGDWPVFGLVITGGTLLFVTLTGVAAWLLPFSTASQVTVLFHTGAGLLLLTPLVYWQVRHWRATRKAPRSVSKISAYAGFWVLAANLLSGAFITFQAIFAAWCSHFWIGLHRWTGVFLVPFIAFHVLPRRLNEPRRKESHAAPSRGWLWLGAFGVAGLLVAALAGTATVYHSAYTAAYLPPLSFRAAQGSNPFAPSYARTTSGRPLPPEIISDSRACGAPGCHAVIYDEWRASAHRWSEEDQFFQAVRIATTEVQGIKATEKCGGCHAPVSLLSGYKDPTLGRGTSGYGEGDSCVVCHAARQVDDRGIGSYVLGIPKEYLYDHDSGRLASFVSHFLIRAYPRQHDRDYDLKIARDAGSCAPCHKEYDKVGKYPDLLEVETQYDDWKQHKWNADRDVSRRLRCQQCHMNLETVARRDLADPYDLAEGLGPKYHNHRFAAANQYMPSALNSPGAEEQTRQVNLWLKGKRDIPETQRVWPQGPIVALKIEGPAAVNSGASCNLRVVLTNNKAGHSFPTGPLNIVRVWIELEAFDKTGRKVFHSGELDRENHVEPGTYVLRPIALTESGHPLLTPDIWHPEGPQFRPAINSGESETLDYRFPIPQSSAGPLVIQARLRYRKANQFFMNEVYDPDHREAPITDVCQVSKEVPITFSGNAP